MSAWTDLMNQNGTGIGGPEWRDPSPAFVGATNATSFGPSPAGGTVQWQRTNGQPSTGTGSGSAIERTLAALLANNGGGAPTAGNYPPMPTGNRFESGLSDAESRIRALLDNPDSVQQSAAYKFRVGQGAEALQRSMGAKGMLNSGNRLMELTKYGQDMGSQEYDAQAGRLGSLLGNYSTSWIGDKNANTSQFAAQSNAANTAQANADRNRYQMGSLAWDMNKPQFASGGGRSQFTPSSYNPGGISGAPDWSQHERLIAASNARDEATYRY